MELVQKGFKQTEVGLIPEDWILRKFDEIFSFYSTSNYSKAQMNVAGDVGCIHYGLVHAIPNTNYNLKNGIKYYVSTKQASYEFVRDGDVIMVDASEDLEGLNKSVEVSGVENNKFIAGLHTYLIRDKNSLLADNYRGIVLNSEVVRNQMLQLAVGMKVFGVSKTQLVKVQIPLPPTLKEQKAIATALSDVDALISSLDGLIAKKKAIKQGAMQQLLTPPSKGGRRLPGFDGDWEEKTIDGITRNIIDYRGVTPKKLGMDWGGGNIIALSAGNVKKGFIDFDSDCYYGSDFLYKKWMRNGDVEKNDIVFTLEAPLGNVSLIPDNKRYILSQRTILLQLQKSEFYPHFIFQVLISDDFQKYISSSATGSTAQGIKRTTFEQLRINIPKDYEEQKAIAEILSDMDAEIEQLETKKAKYQQIKQGMMQELLTGKTRLV
ncbi:restriction endonuclease subunit S [Flavimarina sp. Hel_I_48]|uniref:restriction endonuclease subunit S n=1 Tax=Flavimarina sp. Hel_I_48 TaxID=1392488 RepID=UPI000691B6AE|nr:restriction endonuclease subunit S [Flavimarina sp. Hel_I_48]